MNIGCFSTRNPEPPTQNVNSDWINPVDYNTLIQNFKTATSKLNTQNYLRCLADTFIYVPSASSQSAHPITFANWKKNDEKTYFDNLISKVNNLSGNSLSLQNPTTQFVSVDTLKYFSDYQLSVQHSDTTCIKMAKGKMILTLQQSKEGTWRMLRWQDIEQAKDSSWSVFKVKFLQ